MTDIVVMTTFTMVFLIIYWTMLKGLNQEGPRMHRLINEIVPAGLTGTAGGILAATVMLAALSA